VCSLLGEVQFKEVTMFHMRAAAMVLALGGLGGWLAVPAAMASPAPAQATPTLTEIRAAHHPAFTIANEIMPTLKQFSSVRWVKIYDPAGHTERPTGHTDSIPTCLEP